MKVGDGRGEREEEERGERGLRGVYLYTIGKCGTSEYLAACERLAHLRFSASQSRSVLGWQQEGVRWLLRAEAVLGGGLLADGTILPLPLLLFFFLSFSFLRHNINCI